MGHIVNPVSHRLGKSKCWNSVWTNNSNFPLYYTSLMKSDWDISLFFKRFFELKVLVQSGYIFSHVKIVRECQKIFCVVYFYDGGSLERSDNMRHILLSKTCQLFGIENLFLVSLYAFLRLYQWNSNYVKLVQNFKFQLLFNYFMRKKQFILLQMFHRKRLLLDLVNGFTVAIDFLLIFNIQGLLLFDKLIVLYLKQLLQIDISNSIHWFKFLLTVFLSCSTRLNMTGLIQHPQKQAFLNFYFVSKRSKLLLEKLQFSFSQRVSDLFISLRWQMFNKSAIMSKLIRYGFNFFSFNRYFLYYFGDVFSSYFRLRTRFLKSVRYVFRKLFMDKDNSKIKIILKKMDVTDLNATIMARYITIRLRQRFQLKEALLPMLRHLSYNEYVRGFRVVCAGRFTRKEIALYDLRTYSSVPFSGVSAKLDFALSEVVLKYSICGVKVWLHRVTLPEREYAIDAIGLQFVLPPPIQEVFQGNLELFEDVIDVPFRFEKMNKLFFKESSMNDLDFKSSRRKFITFATRISPTFDFFFLDYAKHVDKAEVDCEFSLFKDKFSI